MQARLMDQPADFKRLGINPDQVEPWEEARREPPAPGHNEVWYFDATFADGSKSVVGFRPKDPAKMATATDSPNVNIMLTTPNGATRSDFHYFTAAEATTGTTVGCDLQYGTDTAKGDFKTYDIHVAPTNGVGCDLHYEALTAPFRQGTGIVAFGDHDEDHHTDLAVPKNKVTGTLTYDGVAHQVTGLGYHDHQWMTTNPISLYHHWLWGRMYTNRYTVYIYDFVAAQRYGFAQLPMFGLLDNETGNLLFETEGQFTLTKTLSRQPQLKRDFPKNSHYVFTNADGASVDLAITWQDELEVRDMYTNLPASAKQQFDAIGAQPAYMRYYAKGTVSYTDATGRQTTSRGDMIYEYAYLGKPDPGAHI